MKLEVINIQQFLKDNIIELKSTSNEQGQQLVDKLLAEYSEVIAASGNKLQIADFIKALQQKNLEAALTLFTNALEKESYHSVIKKSLEKSLEDKDREIAEFIYKNFSQEVSLEDFIDHAIDEVFSLKNLTVAQDIAIRFGRSFDREVDSGLQKKINEHIN